MRAGAIRVSAISASGSAGPERYAAGVPVQHSIRANAKPTVIKYVMAIRLKSAAAGGVLPSATLMSVSNATAKADANRSAAKIKPAAMASVMILLLMRVAAVVKQNIILKRSVV